MQPAMQIQFLELSLKNYCPCPLMKIMRGDLSLLIQVNRLINGDRQIDRKINTQTNSSHRLTTGQKDNRTERQTDRLIDRQTYRQTDRHTDRQTDTKRNIQ